MLEEMFDLDENGMFKDMDHSIDDSDAAVDDIQDIDVVTEDTLEPQKSLEQKSTGPTTKTQQWAGTHPGAVAKD